MRRTSLAMVLAAATALPGVAAADESQQRLPIQDPGVAGKIVALNDCVSESEYDQPSYYGADCRRLKIVFGPIVVQPGKNDVLIQPVTVEKPFWDGYMTRFKPGLVDATGFTPPVEDLHLHHGTWLNVQPSYGSGPWLATGEEKTIAAWPHRYGLKIGGQDTWLFLHMVHSAVATPTVVYATYDIDFVSADVAEAIQPDGRPLLTKTRGIWLDVGGGAAWGNPDPETSTRNDDTFPYNPVYNTHAGFGSDSTGEPAQFSVSSDDVAAYGLDDSVLDLCTWPDQNCARENSSGRVSRQQGNDVGDVADGSEWTAGASYDGSLVVMGGHLHMGGTNDTVDLVRTFETQVEVEPGVFETRKRKFARTIHISDAYYWNWQDPAKVGAPPISWDVSMSGVSADFGWKVRIKEGDKLRINADYETEIGSWYENMGIVMTWVAPDDKTGLDPFRSCTWDGVSDDLSCSNPVTIDHRLIKDANTDGPRDPAQTIAEIAAGDFSVNTPEAAPGYELPDAHIQAIDPGNCVPGPDTLCTRGQITHGHVASADNHDGCRALECDAAVLEDAPAWIGGDISEIHMAGFLYAPGDLTQIPLTGIPTVKLGDSITFYNEDMFASIPHTATACRYPCTGQVTTHYPIPDGAAKVSPTPATDDDPSFLVIDEVNGSKALDTMDFDTTQLGITLGTPTVGDPQAANYTLKTTRTGVFTYFCRIHPFMRGAFEVYDPSTT